MSTVQIVGVAVAAIILVLLIVALVVTRRRGSARDQAQAGASFLDAAPQDTLSSLGKAERPVEDVTLDPEAVEALRDGGAAAAAAAPADPGPQVAAGPTGLPATDAPAPAAGPPAGPPAATAPSPGTVAAAATPSPGDDWAVTGWDAATAPPAAPAPSAPAPPAAPARDADDEAGVTTEDLAGEPPQHAGRPEPARRVPLSDIIVTTSSKVIDLDDPEVRRMLTDLVKFEIDQATRYREQGQTIDAVLQLTEAEKISRALGMNDAAAAIVTMMDDLKRRI